MIYHSLRQPYLGRSFLTLLAMRFCSPPSTCRSLVPMPKLQRQKYSSTQMLRPQVISSMGRQITSSQVEVNHSPLSSFKSFSLMLRKSLILKERRWAMRWGTSRQRLLSFSCCEQLIDHPLSALLVCWQNWMWLLHTMSAFCFWQMWLNTFSACSPSTSSSPSISTPMSPGSQYCVAALWMLGTAVMCYLFLTTVMFCLQPCSLMNQRISQQVLSLEASSMMTILQFLQLRFTIDCRLYWYRKALALLMVGTIRQKGNYYSLKSYCLERRFSSVERSLLIYRQTLMLEWGRWKLFCASMKAFLAFQLLFKKPELPATPFMKSIFLKQCCSLISSCIIMTVSWVVATSSTTIFWSELAPSPLISTPASLSLMLLGFSFAYWLSFQACSLVSCASILDSFRSSYSFIGWAC